MLVMLQGEYPIRKERKKKKKEMLLSISMKIFLFLPFLERIETLRALAGGRTIKRLKLPCFHEECHSVSLMQRFYSC